MLPPVLSLMLAGCGGHQRSSAGGPDGEAEISPATRAGFGNDFAAAARVPANGRPVAITPGDGAMVNAAAEPVPIETR